MNTKTVIEIIVDGRARALALVNLRACYLLSFNIYLIAFIAYIYCISYMEATLCYGEESLEMGKCLLDYANACALQGSWEIAQERSTLIT